MSSNLVNLALLDICKVNWHMELRCNKLMSDICCCGIGLVEGRGE